MPAVNKKWKPTAKESGGIRFNAKVPMHLFGKLFGHTFDIGQPLALPSMAEKILQAQRQIAMSADLLYGFGPFNLQNSWIGACR
jgi:hypothetical protein